MRFDSHNKLKERERERRRSSDPLYRMKRQSTNYAWRMSRYGITPEIFAEESKNGCHMCGRLEKLQIDHDHVTGEYRGLLCGRCNKALGLLGDNITTLMRATAYLTKRNCDPSSQPTTRR